MASWWMLLSGGVATIRVSHSTATNNTDCGFTQLTSGVFESLGNNLVRGNATGHLRHDHSRRGAIALGEPLDVAMEQHTMEHHPRTSLFAA